ncbi:hypothetical protein ACFQY0_20180 [Haloferula chungangensis]|uniref:Uncharacterized protein n=1 Tax=Haloferula chungangensis TaxID=1048331 RepID=A0ABW2LDD6_9BACT
MSKSNQRDAAKEALAAMMSSSSAPGTEQAQKASVEKPPAAVQVSSRMETAGIEQPVKKARSSASKAKPALSVVVPQNGGGEGKAEKISISLHPEDLERLESFENGLRKAGLVGRRAPTSFLLKVALAALDFGNLKGLSGAVAEITAQDGRRK